MRLLANTTLWWLCDRIFPTAEPLSSEQRQYNARREAEQSVAWDERATVIPESLLEEYLDQCRRALADEQDRGRGVDGRLTTAIGLSGIAGSIVFGTMLSKAQGPTSALQWVTLATLFYLTLQIVSAMLAGVRGLERRSYRVDHSIEILPAVNEPREEHLRRQIRSASRILIQHQNQHNDKVTQMAVAHVAMKNFLWGLLSVAILAMVSPAVAPTTNDAIVERVKQDRELRELLRGPQGAPGVAGVPGPAGSSCMPPPAANAVTKSTSKR